MNKIIVSGNICKDIEVKYYNDKKFIKNTIAVRRDFKNKDGNYDSDFLNFSVWGAQAEYLKEYANKGDKIIISGKILNNNYQGQNGEMIYSNDIQVENIEIISRKNAGERLSDSAKNVQKAVDEVKELFGEEAISIVEEDLPF